LAPKMTLQAEHALFSFRRKTLHLRELLGVERMAEKIDGRHRVDIERTELEYSSRTEKTAPIVARFGRIFFAGQIKIEIGHVAQDDFEAGIGQTISDVFAPPPPDVVPNVRAEPRAHELGVRSRHRGAPFVLIDERDLFPSGHSDLVVAEDVAQPREKVSLELT